MEIINKPRAFGKTTELIKLASKGRYKLIVCHTRKEADRVWSRILEMEKNKEIEGHPPQPITFEEFLQRRYEGMNIESFLIDNVDICLQSITPVRIEAVSFTDNKYLEQMTGELKNTTPQERFENEVVGRWPDDETQM